MAELATIARPYAEALFKAAGSALSAPSACLDQLAAIAVHPLLLLLAYNPKTPDHQLFHAVPLSPFTLPNNRDIVMSMVYGHL